MQPFRNTIIAVAIYALSFLTIFAMEARVLPGTLLFIVLATPAYLVLIFSLVLSKAFGLASSGIVTWLFFTASQIILLSPFLLADLLAVRGVIVRAPRSEGK